MKDHVTSNTHVKYERCIYYSYQVIAKVKVFVHATDADADADTDVKAVTLAPWT